MVQEWWRTLNANERMAATGAIIVLIAGILGSGWLSVVGTVIVLAVYWLKYSPNQQFTWPLAPELINLGISAILGLLALFGLLTLIGFGGLGLGLGFGFLAGFYIVYLVGVIANAIGVAMMLLGTWREYQAMPKTAPPAPPAPPSAPPPPPAS
jgi:hypothetical protein